MGQMEWKQEAGLMDTSIEIAMDNSSLVCIFVLVI